MERVNSITRPKSDIRKTIKSLRGGSPLRRLAESVVADPSVRISNISTVLRPFQWITVVPRNSLQVSAWLVRNANWTAEQRKEIGRQLSTLISVETTVGNFAGIIFDMSLLYGLIFGAMSILQAASKHYRIVEILETPLMILTFPCAFIPVFCFQSFRLKRRRTIIHTLGVLRDLSNIDVIVDAYSCSVWRPAVETALLRIVNCLDPDNFGALPKSVVPRLGKLIAGSPSPRLDLKLIILRAMCVVGDKRTIKSIESLIAQSTNPRLLKAAEETISIIEQRELDEQASAQLLRSVYYRTDDDTTSLLRATQAEGKDTGRAEIQGPVRLTNWTGPETRSNDEAAIERNQLN